MSNLAGALLMAIAASSAHEHAMCSGYCADIEKEIDRRIAAALAAKAEPNHNVPCAECNKDCYSGMQLQPVCFNCRAEYRFKTHKYRAAMERSGWTFNGEKPCPPVNKGKAEALELQARIDRALALIQDLLPSHVFINGEPCPICKVRAALKGETA